MGPIGVNDDIRRFSGKRNPSATPFFFFFFFLISIAKWSIKEDDAIMSTVAEGKGNTCGENEKKNRKICRGARQRIDRQLSKLRSKLVLAKRKGNLVSYGKFCKVRDVKDEPHHKQLPRKLPQGTRQGLRL